MAEQSKKKIEPAALREAKPKKKLGLVVPQPFRMPHEELFGAPATTGNDSQPVVNSDQQSIATRNNKQPAIEQDRQPETTGNLSQPAPEDDQSSEITSQPNQPDTNNDLLQFSTGQPRQPDTINDQPPAATSRQERPVEKQNQVTARTGQHLQPATPKSLLQKTTGALIQPVAEQPVIETDLKRIKDRSQIATGKYLPPVVRPNEYRAPNDEYFLTPNSVSDEVQKALTDEQFSVYFRLFRLSHGFKQTTCFVGYNSLATALNWKVWKVKKVMPELLRSGYVRIVETYNGQGLKGTVYEVITSQHSQPANSDNRSLSETGSAGRHNKHDHDDLTKQNPHQSAVMRIYEELTGNQWSKADGLQYQKLTGLTANEIEDHMRVIHSRAVNRIGSLAYFVKGIEQALSQGGQQSPSTLETQYKQIVREIAAAWVGGTKQPSEWVDKLKWRCIQEGLTWNNDIANKVLGL